VHRIIEQATVDLPHADRDANLPVSIYLVHLSSERCERGPSLRAESTKLRLVVVAPEDLRRRPVGFDGRQQEHRATVFFSDGGMVELAGTDADRVLNAMEDFAGYHRS